MTIPSGYASVLKRISRGRWGASHARLTSLRAVYRSWVRRGHCPAAGARGALVYGAMELFVSLSGARRLLGALGGRARGERAVSMLVGGLSGGYCSRTGGGSVLAAWQPLLYNCSNGGGYDHSRVDQALLRSVIVATP